MEEGGGGGFGQHKNMWEFGSSKRFGIIAYWYLEGG